MGVLWAWTPTCKCPTTTQNFNRYSYALNNPLVYTDPNGESLLGVGIAMFFGTVMNTMMQGIAGNVNNAGQFFTAIGVGALSAVAGYGVGGAVAADMGVTSFVGGALSSGYGGLAGGFVGGAANAWALNGATFSQGLEQGILGASSGGALGALTGGIIGGCIAAKHGGNFWSGKGAVYLEFAPEMSGNKIKIADDLEYSNKFAREFSDENFGTVKSVENLYADGSLAKGLVAKGDFVYDAKGRSILGATESLGAGKGSNVYLYKAAFTSKEQFINGSMNRQKCGSSELIITHNGLIFSEIAIQICLSMRNTDFIF
ncbi:MAG: hypothetical protein PUB21_11180 [Bacteroidales bacterium]|nr:hypothetical protein [Bacteroidales bacterium]